MINKQDKNYDSIICYNLAKCNATFECYYENLERYFENNEYSETKSDESNSIDEYFDYNRFFFNNAIQVLITYIERNTNFCDNVFQSFTSSNIIDIECAGSSKNIGINEVNNSKSVNNRTEERKQTFTDKVNCSETKFKS